MQHRECRTEVGEEAVLRLVQAHAAELLRFARRFSHCADDAHDAYQRALETLVRRMRSDPPEQPLSWIRTVLRHEAVTLRAERDAHVGRFEADFERHACREAADPAERVVDHERLRHAAEALRRLKPQELTALALRAEGLSYREICTRTGWTYTRTNRAITEGRRALIDRLGAIESGAECERWEPLLSALADGEVGAGDLAHLRTHLRSCPACRATLRDFHTAPAQVAALVPAGLVPLAAAATPGSGLRLRHLEPVVHGLAERATLLVARVQGTFEAVPSAKLAAVVASTAALAGGGAALQHAAGTAHARTAATHAAQMAADTGPASLTTLAVGLPNAPHAVPALARHGRRGAARRSEFAPDARPQSEFERGAGPRAEFAAAPASPRATVAQSASAPSSASSPAPSGTAAGASPPSAGHDAPPEFFAGP